MSHTTSVTTSRETWKKRHAQTRLTNPSEKESKEAADLCVKLKSTQFSCDPREHNVEYFRRHLAETVSYGYHSFLAVDIRNDMGSQEATLQYSIQSSVPHSTLVETSSAGERPPSTNTDNQVNNTRKDQKLATTARKREQTLATTVSQQGPLGELCSLPVDGGSNEGPIGLTSECQRHFARSTAA